MIIRRPLPARAAHAFTLVEVLAALVLIAIVVPVTMQGVGVANRAGLMGQRRAAAMRIAERVLNEAVIAAEPLSASSTGTTVEGSQAYAWTLTGTPWPTDAMTQLTVTVNFVVQGETFEASASTLIDPAAGAAAAEATP